MSTDEVEAPVAAVDFYWRPGCVYCMMLGRALKKRRVPMNRLNIWDDPDHAAAVRSWADGDETVPTVVIAGLGLVNPTGDQVMRVLEERAPHLVAKKS